MTSPKLLTVVGARPQFIKAAAVSRALRDRPGHVREVLVHSGQHYDPQMSEVFFQELEIPAPTHHLEVGSGPHSVQTGEMLIRLDAVLRAERPDAVMVYGDTNTTIAGALAAAKANLPLIHVEAGLRSFDRSMPEEINRVVTDHLATHLLCPSRTAVSNLAREGIEKGVELVGDVMYDVLLRTCQQLPEVSASAASVGLDRSSFALVTVHRASNTDNPERFNEIVEAVEVLAERVAPVIWPVHPRLRAAVASRSISPRVHLIEPVSYTEMLTLLREATLVATDSGGLQKEAMWMTTPCCTLRSETEWTETVEAGWNVLVGDDLSDLADQADRMVRRLRGSTAPPPVYGDGNAAELVVAVINRVLAS